MEQRDSRFNAIMIIVLTMLATVFLVKNIGLLLDQRELNNRIDELNHNILDPKEIEKRIEEYNDIDNTIINKREEYYNNIRKLEEKIINGESDKKIAYLTFDDGPYELT